jgi:TonB-linked SusC/RagA family outer membrane protein
MSAQSVTLNYENVSLKVVFASIKKQTGLNFSYSTQQVDPERTISINVTGESVENALKKLLAGTNLTFEKKDKNVLIYEKPNDDKNVTVKSKKISGLVTDEKGDPIIGATIIETGTNKGTVTDINGLFSLETTNAGQLKVSFIGYESQTIAIAGKTILKISMNQATKNLDEVVVVGYGTMKKSDITGSVASIRSGEIKTTGEGTLEQALFGKVAGVTIMNSDNAPGSGMNIRIRGTSSINASSAPLYVIDGFPVEGSFSEGELESTGQSPLSGIDPGDIESIDILKDASATAIYGARGANGVIIITTKSGKEGKMEVSFNTQYGVQRIIDAYDVMDAGEYAKFMHNRYFPFDKRITPPNAGDNNFKWWDYQTYSHPDSTNTNWIDEITRLGETKNYNLSVSGGNKKGSYMASVGYYNNKGIVKETDFSRYTANFKAKGNPNEWLELDFSTLFAYTDNDGTVTVNSEGTAFKAGIFQQAIKTSPLKLPDDSFFDDDNTDDVTGNPLATLRSVDMKRKNISSVTNAAITLKPMKGLRLKIMGGMRHNREDFKYYAPSTTSWGLNYNGHARINQESKSSWLNENTITYIKKSGKHSFNGLAGFTIQSQDRFRTELEASNFPIETLGYWNIGVGESFSPPKSYGENSLLLSYLGRINYDFDNRYLITASFRADGSSKFSRNNKWGYFPSFAFAWRVSQEAFMKDVKFINNLKLRAGWGETGNPNIPPYQSLLNYNLTKYPSASTLYTGTYPLNTGNPNLKWETTEQLNIGVDLSLWNSRVTVAVDAYKKITKDLLLNGDIPPSMGFYSYLYNSGSVKNDGIEIAINTLNINGKLKWFSDFNITFNRNEVTDLGELTTNNWISVPNTKNYSTAILQEGRPIGLWYGYKTNGLWQQNEFTWNGRSYDLKADAEGRLPASLAGDQPGMWKRVDISGPDGNPDGKIDSWDKTVIGVSQPKFVGGLNNRFEYKNIDLSIQFEWSYGKDVYNANNLFFIEPYGLSSNSIVVDHWLPTQYALDENGKETNTVLDPGNPEGKYPGPGLGVTFADLHDAYIEDGSYLRIRNISLGYKFKGSVIRALNIASLKLSANILNLYTFTNYSGYDPNINGNDLGGLRPGYDLSSYPLARTFMLGISAEF